MSVNSYPVIISEGESGKYIANCPSIEGCFSQGDTIQEAIENIKEAIALCIEVMIERGEDLPRPSITFLSEVTVEL